LRRKLSEVLPQEKESFLKLKYRELRLMHRVDRLTDRYDSLSKLVHASLKLIRQFFSCKVAAFLVAGNPNVESLIFQTSLESVDTDGLKNACNFSITRG